MLAEDIVKEVILAENENEKDESMLKTIITALFTYIATSIDEIPVLFMLYTKKDNRGKDKTITAAYFAGTFLLIGISLLGAFGLGQIPEKWVIGLLGLVPFVMGLKILIKGESEDEDEEADRAIAASKKYKTLFVQVLAITLGLGADDIGVFIPLFTTLSGWEILLMMLVFVIATALLCTISFRMTKINALVSFIEKYERYIVGIVFTVLGVMILLESGTIAKFVSLFG